MFFFIPRSRGLIQLFFCGNFVFNSDLVEYSTQLLQRICKIMKLTLPTQYRKIITVPINILSGVVPAGTEG